MEVGFDEIIETIEQSGNSIEVFRAYVPEAQVRDPRNIVENLKYCLNIHTDIIHITGDIHYCACITNGRRTILTINDFGLLECDNNILIKGVAYFFWFLIPILRSRIITCISPVVYKKAISLFPWAAKKISLVPYPVGCRFSFQYREISSSDIRILCIGTQKRKNLESMIIAANRTNCILDIVGELSNEQRNVLQSSGVRYTNSYKISNEDLLEKYLACDIVAFVSTYEGFGVPIIEGQAIGRAVITSNIEPMLWVSGGEQSACIVDPYSVDSITEGIKKIIYDNEYRQMIIMNGVENAKRFTSKEISKIYIELYKKIESARLPN